MASSMPNSPALRCGAIVLCGGKSSRMGLSKASLPFGNETMLARIIRIVSEVVEQTIVVATPDQEVNDLPESAILVHDRLKDRGPLEGLAAGIAAAQDTCDIVFVTSCDVPRLVPQFIERLFSLLGEHQIVVPKEEDYHHPLSAVYRTSLHHHIEVLLQTDRMRPFFLLSEVDTLEVPVEQLRDVDPELASLENVNCPHDYFLAVERAGFSVPEDIRISLKRFQG